MATTPEAIGIDFGGTSIKFGVCAGAEIIASAEPIDTTTFYDRAPETLIGAIAGRVNELKTDQVRAVGVGIPGLVDFERGHIFEITNVPGWTDIPFRDLLGERTGLPVTIDNDANCMAYAEWKLGAGRGYHHAIAITLGTGVGGGLIINDRLHRGAQFCAGELGETIIDHTAARPAGTIEKFVGNREIAAHAKQLYATAGTGKNLEDCTPKILAENTDDIARRVWRDVAGWLATALSNAIWLLNPEAIIIGGGVAKAGQVLFDPLREELQKRLSPVLAENLELLAAEFGNEAGIIGAAAQAAAS